MASAPYWFDADPGSARNPLFPRAGEIRLALRARASMALGGQEKWIDAGALYDEPTRK
jgi:hypothetical protein